MEVRAREGAEWIALSFLWSLQRNLILSSAPIQTPVTTDLLSVSIDLPSLDFSNRWNCNMWPFMGGGLCPQDPSPSLATRMRISLPIRDLLGEERLLISQRRRSKSLFLNGLLLGSVCHQSLSGSKDQTIDNIQRTLRAYSESGSVS